MSKTFWVLPDIHQQGKLWVIDSLTNEKLSLIDFYKLYDIKNVAKEFEIGIPEELLNKFKSEKYAFAQIIKNKKDTFFSISARCGKDIDGRTVTLTYIQIVNELRELKLPDQEDLNFLKTLNEDLTFQIDSETVSKINRLKKASISFNDIKSFCSDKLQKTVYKHDWNGEDPSTIKKWIWLGGGIIFLIILGLIFK